MPSGPVRNKYRAAIDVLMSGRDVLVGGLADDILDQSEDLVDGGFLFNEFLESQGTRLHFLGLMIAQLEQSADLLEEAEAAPPPPPAPAPKKRKPRAKKLATQQASTEPHPDDL